MASALDTICYTQASFGNSNIDFVLIMNTLLGEVQNLDREMKKCLIDSFKKTDEAFLQKASAASPSWKVSLHLLLPHQCDPLYIH